MKMNKKEDNTMKIETLIKALTETLENKDLLDADITIRIDFEETHIIEYNEEVTYKKQSNNKTKPLCDMTHEELKEEKQRLIDNQSFDIKQFD